MSKRIIKEVMKLANSLGNKRECYTCGKTFNKFTKYRGGCKHASPFIKKLDFVNSDNDNFGCMYCGSHDRERHLFMFFDKLGLWESMKNKKILHFAPEKNLKIKIAQQRPLDYVQADLYPANQKIKKMDATEIEYSDETFDFLIANHILEHIPNYNKALSEFYRVLKPGGIAVLQTPFSKLLKNNFEDEGIESDELKLYFYGQEDHVRVFGECQLLDSLKEAGFSLRLKSHENFFSQNDAYYYGVPAKEYLIMVEK